MKFSKEIKSIEEAIVQLKQIGALLDTIEATVLEIEENLCNIDESVPHIELEPEKFTENDKKQYDRLVVSLSEAYSLVDEILGPPDEEPKVPIPQSKKRQMCS